MKIRTLGRSTLFGSCRKAHAIDHCIASGVGTANVRSPCPRRLQGRCPKRSERNADVLHQTGIVMMVPSTLKRWFQGFTRPWERRKAPGGRQKLAHLLFWKTLGCKPVFKLHFAETQQGCFRVCGMLVRYPGAQLAECRWSRSCRKGAVVPGAEDAEPCSPPGPGRCRVV
jgi:hypothetical protein